eukprot:2873300-Lingulodinium_polyedra.AAC.1
MVPVACHICGTWPPNSDRHSEHIRSKVHKRNAGLIPPRPTLAPALALAQDCASCYLRLLDIRCHRRICMGCTALPPHAPPFP